MENKKQPRRGKPRGKGQKRDPRKSNTNSGGSVSAQQRAYHKQESAETPDAPVYMYLIKNQKTSETYICGSDTFYQSGDFVVAPTRYGLDMAVVLGFIRSMMLSSVVKDLEEHEQPFIDDHSSCEGCDGCAADEEKIEEEKIEEERKVLFEEALEQERLKRNEKLKNVERIDRSADPVDLAQYEDNRQKAEDASVICKEKIKQHKLEMKLVDAHYLLCEPKVIFFFTAENRVDFRALVKDLVSVFRMRIELRQIGVRDESRVLGGLGVCGRDYCCHGVSDRLKPVSIKMAKEQNLSLNSMKISGPCGRLLCCLAYEYDFYKEEKSKLPSVGNKLKIRNEMLKISEVNILSKTFSLTAFDGRMLSIPFEKVVFNEETGRWDVDKEFIEEVLSV